MLRSQEAVWLAPAVALALCACVGTPARTSPDPSEDEQRTAAVDLESQIRSWIESAREQRAQGALDGARAQIRAAVDASRRASAEDCGDLLALLRELDAEAGELEMLAERAGLRELIVSVCERELGEEHPETLAAKSRLAWTLRALGENARARDLAEAWIEFGSRTLPADDAGLLDAKRCLSRILDDLGDLEGSRALAQEVIEGYERTRPEDDADLLAVKLDLCIEIEELGDPAAALRIEQGVLAILERTRPRDSGEILRARHNMAVTKSRLGDYGGALELYTGLVATYERTYPEEHPTLLLARQNLAVTLRKLGDLTGARAIEEDVLAIRERTLPADHHSVARSRINLAMTLWSLGDESGAHRLVGAMLDTMQAQLAGFRMDSPRSAREDARAILEDRFLVALSMSTSGSPELQAQIFSVLESLRHVAVSSTETAHALTTRPDLKQVQGEVADLRAQLNDLVVGGGAPDEDDPTRRRRVQHLAFERDRLERSIRRELSGTGAFVGAIDARQIAAELEPDGVVLSFFRYTRSLVRDDSPGKFRPPIDSLLAFLVHADGTVERIELGPAAPIEAAALAWRAAIGAPLGATRGVSAGAPATTAGADADAGTLLRRLLLDPVLARSPGSRTVHVCPDDFLFLVPLDALPAGDSSADCVGDRIALHYEVTLGRILTGRRFESSSEPSLIAAGGIDYAAPGEDVVGDDSDASSATWDGTRSGALGTLAPLPGTLLEVRAISRTFEAEFGSRALVLSGTLATKRALREGVSGRRFVHLATHGWFAPETVRSDEDRPGESAPGSDLTQGTWQESVTTFAPMTLCGLGLVGANRGRDSEARVPGILTAEELAGLDLSACDLAVLSACETNVGPHRAGLGIQSLQTALLAAGARTGITSLWRVDDAATRLLFERFYVKLWREKLGKGEALWQAKMALRAEGHPLRDWAGWVLSGEKE